MEILLDQNDVKPSALQRANCRADLCTKMTGGEAFGCGSSSRSRFAPVLRRRTIASNLLLAARTASCPGSQAALLDVGKELEIWLRG